MNASLGNHLLIAMPSLIDSSFERSVIYICEHQEEGTVGLIINRPLEFPLSFVFEQMHIKPTDLKQNQKPLLYGGPVQQERGFVLHRPVGSWRSSTPLGEDVSITTSSDILKAIATDKGPKDALVALGYAGWGANQLEAEMIQDSWLVCPYRPELLYEVPFANRWEYAASTIGVKMSQLISTIGHA